MPTFFRNESTRYYERFASIGSFCAALRTLNAVLSTKEIRIRNNRPRKTLEFYRRITFPARIPTPPPSSFSPLLYPVHPTPTPPPCSSSPLHRIRTSVATLVRTARQSFMCNEAISNGRLSGSVYIIKRFPIRGRSILRMRAKQNEVIDEVIERVTANR